MPKLSAVLGTVVVYNTFTHARHYHAMVFCETSINKDPKFQPMAISVKHVDNNMSLAMIASSQKSPSLWVEIWRLIKPDLLLLILVALTAVGAAVVNLQTPSVTGELINVIAQSIKGAGELSMEELKKPAMKLLGLFLSQGKDKCVSTLVRNSR
jgi:hypothetical protein